MRLIIPTAALALLAVWSGAGCGRTSEKGVAGPAAGPAFQVKGSDTMVNLVQAWAEAYAAEFPDSNITVSGGGSGTGIAALINGDTDVASSSREMKGEEIEQASEKGRAPERFEVAQDGLSVIVHPSNPVAKLTIEELSGIFTGRITNWKQVGGNDEPITALSRERNSGTHVFFLEHVVRKGKAKGPEEFAPEILMLPSSQAIADEVGGTKSAIGYVGMGYFDPAKHKHILVAKDAAGPFVEPKPENVLNKTYPIARGLYLYTLGKPSAQVQAFLDFILGSKGQKIVTDMEFVPVK